ncbi:MAG TPA: protein phosphatase 2C domain-containing protein [Spongiibacteraceae bacterium]|jgi:protein phosphatase
MAGSHPGNKRTHNEDATFFDEEIGLAVIADGMGGHTGGEVASHIVVDTFIRTYVSGADLVGIALEAHKSIIERSQSQSELRGMGSTLVVAHAGPRSFQIAWVGDSRAYHWRPDHGIRQITRDHSLVEQLFYAARVPLIYWMVRRPLAVVRQYLGV